MCTYFTCRVFGKCSLMRNVGTSGLLGLYFKLGMRSLMLVRVKEQQTFVGWFVMSSQPSCKGLNGKICLQAEQEMLQRSSFEAARRNSMSCDAPLDPSASSQLRPDAFSGSAGSLEFARGQSEASRQAGIRRMSMDNLSSQRQTGKGPSQQGDPPPQKSP